MLWVESKLELGDSLFFISSFLIVCINMQISVYRDWLKCPITTQTVVFQVANQTASYCMTKTKQNNSPPPLTSNWLRWTQCQTEWMMWNHQATTTHALKKRKKVVSVTMHHMEQGLKWESVIVSNKMFRFLATKSTTKLVKTLSSVAPEEAS